MSAQPALTLERVETTTVPARQHRRRPEEDGAVFMGFGLRHRRLPARRGDALVVA